MADAFDILDQYNSAEEEEERKKKKREELIQRTYFKDNPDALELIDWASTKPKQEEIQQEPTEDQTPSQQAEEQKNLLDNIKEGVSRTIQGVKDFFTGEKKEEEPVEPPINQEDYQALANKPRPLDDDTYNNLNLGVQQALVETEEQLVKSREALKTLQDSKSLPQKMIEGMIRTNPTFAGLGLLDEAVGVSPEKKLQERIERLEGARKIYREHLGLEQTEKGFLKGLWSAVSKPLDAFVPFYSDVNQLDEALEARSALEKYQKGEDLNDDEKALVHAFRAKAINETIDRGVGHQVGNIVGNMPSYVISFFLTAGVGKLAASAVIKGGSKMLVGRMATSLARGSIATIAQSSIMIPRIANNTAQYMLPQVDYVAGKEGDDLLNNLDKGKGFEEALARGYLKNVIEVGSERMGAVIEAPIPFLKKAILGKYAQKIGLPGSKAFSDLAKKAGWNGIIGEVFEEEINEIMQAPLDEREYYAPLMTPEGTERLLVETLGITAFGGIARVPDLTIETIKNVRQRRKEEDLIDIPVTEEGKETPAGQEEQQTIAPLPSVIAEEVGGEQQAAEPITEEEKAAGVETLGEEVKVYRGATAGETLNVEVDNGITGGVSTSTDREVAERFAEKKQGAEVQEFILDENAKVINHSTLEKMFPDLKPTELTPKVKQWLKDHNIDVVRFDVAEGAGSEAELRIINERAVKARSQGIRPADIREEEVPAFEQVETAGDEMVKQYIAKNDNLVGADEAKEGFAEYDPSQSQKVHRASTVMRDKVYDTLLSERAGQRNNTVLFTAGGTGAGKSETLEESDRANYPVIYDSTFAHLPTARKVLRQARSRNYKTVISFTLADPVAAYDRVIQRGRSLSVDQHIKYHVGALKNIKTLYNDYKDDPNVAFIFYDNRGELGQAKEVNFDFLKGIEYNEEELRKDLQKYEGKETRSTTEENKGRTGEEGAEEPQQPNAEEVRKETEVTGYPNFITDFWKDRTPTAFTPERLKLANVSEQEVIDLLNQATDLGVDQDFLLDRSKYTATKIAIDDITEAIKDAAKTGARPQQQRKTTGKKPKFNVKKLHNALGKKTSLSALQEMIQVKDGKAIFTNLDVEVQIPTEAKEGAHRVIDGELFDKPDFNVAENFPTPQSQAPNLKATFLKQDLEPVFKAATIAASTDNYRPLLQGILLEANNGKATVTATDGYRLFHKTLPGKIEGDFTLKLANAKQIASFLEIFEDGRLEIRQREGVNDQAGVIQITDGSSSIFAKELEGEFPAYDKVFPAYNNRIIFSKKELADAVKQVTPIAKESANIINFKQDGNEIVVSARNNAENISKEVRVPFRKGSISHTAGQVLEGILVMPIRQEAETEGVSLNYVYVQDAIKSLEGNDVYFSYEGEGLQGERPTHFSDKAERSKAYTGGSTTSARASKGTFTDEPPRTNYTNGVRIIDFPELVMVAKELSGSFPSVKGLRFGTRGFFNPLMRSITLDKNVFKDPGQAAKTLAHELGHLVDFIADSGYTMKRGNLLGRLASLKGYRKSFIADEPPAERNLITEEDRKALRKEAKEIAKKPVKLTEEIVVGEKAITPEEILAIWNELGISEKDPDLLAYIQTLNDAQKVEVAKAAMKNSVPEWVNFRRKVTEKVTKEVLQNTPEDIKNIYKDLLKKEVEKRRLVSLEVVREELYNLSKSWRPFDEANSSSSFIQYRNSGEEIYADAMSVLFNDPQRLKEEAPVFWRAWFNYLDNKSEAKEAFFATWDLLSLGEEAVLSDRRKRIQDMFEKGEDRYITIRAEERQKKKDYAFLLKYELVDKNQKVIDLVGKAKKEGKAVNDDDNPVYWLEEQNYVGGVQKAWVEKHIQPIYKDIIDNGLSWETLGEALFLERAANERGEMANPLGFTKPAAEAQLDFLQKQLGSEGWEVLQRNLTSYRQAINEITKKAEEAELYTDELIGQMKANPTYATYQVIDYMDLNIPASVKRQIGTLKEVSNPATATIMKSLSIIRAAERNMAKRKVIDFLQETFPKEIRDAKTRFISKGDGGYHEPIPSREDNEALFELLEKGKIKGYYVDPYISSTFDYMNTGTANAVIGILRFFNSGLFRPLFITFNLGFQSFNLMRDFVRFYKNVPGMNIPKAIFRYSQAAKPAFARAFNLPDKTIQEMEEVKILNVTFNDLIKGEFEGDKEVDRILERTGLSPLAKKKQAAWKTLMKPFTGILDLIKSTGDLIETLPKVAGYKELNGKMPNKELASFIRTSVGSPDFLRGGKNYRVYNEIFLFSNAIKEGIRSDLGVAFQNPKTRVGYWWKTAWLTFLPKFVMMAALMGFFGDWLKKRMEDVSEYDMTNYSIIPLGIEGERTVYLRVPQDETGRLLGGILWKALGIASRDEKKLEMKDVMNILSYTGGQLPSVTPLIESLGATAQFMAGKNPYDAFAGRNIIPDDEFAVGGTTALKPFLIWQFQNLGGSVFWKYYITEQTPETKGWVQQQVEKPFLSNIVGRWLKVSNYGQKEKNREIIKEVEKEKAAQRLEDKEALRNAVEEYRESPSVIKRRQIERELVRDVIGNPPYKDDRKRQKTNLEKKFRLMILKGEADPNITSLIEANTNAEKTELLKKIKGEMTASEFMQFKRKLLQEKVISEDFYKTLRRL